MFGFRNSGGPWLQSYLDSRTLVVILIAYALLLDNMLLTSIVPIMPEFLYQLEHPEQADFQNMTGHIHSPITCKFSKSKGNVLNNSICDQFNDTAGDDKTQFSSEVNNTYQKVHVDLMHETMEIGILLASKPLIQLMTIPVISSMMSRISCDTFVLGGFLTIFISTLIFSFGNSYAILFVGRSLQGFGSACVTLAGMSIIAEIYPENEERGNAIGFALSGLAMGTLIGPTYGGVLYELCGKTVPFLILSSLAVLGLGLQLIFVRVPRIKKPKLEIESMKSVISDPYILIASGAITIANMGLALLEPTLPVWMMDTMKAHQWQQGAVFFPESVCYLITMYYIGTWSSRFGRWLISMVGFVILGFSFLMLPLTRNFLEIIVPMLILGLSMGLIDGTMTSELGNLADIRHSAIYGGVYALQQLAECCGNTIAPAVSGLLVNNIGFKWTSTALAAVCIAYAPLMYFLKNPCTKEEKDKLVVC